MQFAEALLKLLNVDFDVPQGLPESADIHARKERASALSTNEKWSLPEIIAVSQHISQRNLAARRVTLALIMPAGQSMQFFRIAAYLI